MSGQTSIAPAIERRFVTRRQPQIETRQDGGEVITGYAAVYFREDDPGTQFQIFDDLFERIMPGAFDAALRENDEVVALFNHDTNFLLGRNTSGTLRLSTDSVGLRYEIDAPERSDAKDLIVSLRRGDVVGSSFAFRLFGKRGKQRFVEENIDGNLVEVREILEVELLDVGPVTRPAYESTSAGLRSGEAEALERARTVWRRTKACEQIDFAGRRARLDLEAMDLNIGQPGEFGRVDGG